MAGSMSSKPGPFARLSAVEPSSPARSSIPGSSQSSTTGRPSRASRSTVDVPVGQHVGPGRSQVSTNERSRGTSRRGRRVRRPTAGRSPPPARRARASPVTSGSSINTGSTRRRARGCAQGSHRSRMRTPATPVLRAPSLPRPTGGRAEVAGRDRLWHRDAGGEGGPLEPEHVLDGVGPAAVGEIHLLHRERPLVVVEPVHPVGEPAVDADHRPGRRTELRETHPEHCRTRVVNYSFLVTADRR